MLIHTARIPQSFRYAFVLGLLALIIAGCGGGGGGGAPPQSPPSDLSYASPIVLTVGVEAPMISPTVTGNVTTYSISSALPAGLSLSASTGKITGTPVTESAAASYVVTAQNAAGSTTFTLSLAVLIPAPSALSYASPETYLIGTAISALSPTVTGLVTKYAVAPALPAGLSLDAVTGQITGTPSTATAMASYVITASNGSGSTNFSLTLSVLIPPPSALSYASPQTWISGTPITPISPSVTGMVTQYSVMPALPPGLLLNSATGQISGTPTAAVALANYLVTASNGSGATSFTLTVTVLVPPPSGLSYPSPQTFTAGTAITPISPTVTGIVTYYLSQPALPAGLSLDPTSGRITGAPTAAAPAANYLITAGNGTGSTTFGLAITVRIAAPSALSYKSPKIYHVGTAITPLSPMVTGTVASYGVSPALPPGLTLNPTTGLISGTPTAAQAAANYAITASNSTGSTSFMLSITVVLLPPTSLSYSSPQTFGVGSLITPLTPFVVGVVASYTVSPALPAGLSLDSNSGQITGTPTTLTPAAPYTVTATNAAGSSTFALSITVATVGVTPAQISRLVAAGTPVVIQLAVQSQSLTGTLYVIASDPSNLFNSAVNVTNTANGYAVALTVSTAIAPGHYSGNVLLTLCKDAACTMPQAPASIDVPFNVQVLSATSTWPGNNEPPLAAWSAVPDWTMFQGNAAHTGYVPATIDPNTFTTRWQGGPTLSNTPNNYTGAFAYTLTTDGGQLYIAFGTTLYAFKELDASQVWSYDVSGLQFPSVNPPAEANGTVYMAAGQQGSTSLFAFDETSGSIVFKSQMSSQWEHYFAPTIGPDGVYTNAGTYGGLYGFDFSGNLLFFNNSLLQVSQWTPAVDNSHVYSYAFNLTISDPVTGTDQATIKDPNSQDFNYFADGSAVLGASGSVFASSYSNAYINGGGLGNFLLDFNVNTQAITWQQSGDYGYNPAYNAGVLYAANNNPLRLEARSESDGSLLWSWTPPQAGDNTFDSEVLLTNSMIFVSTNLATYGIDAVTHQLVFSYPFPGRLALSQNGILYIQGTGPIVAINVK
jgi:Putative Ig domain/PQQ-like domain